MANINDYLLWRGDIPINRNFKFNEIDSMILARFSYLLFNKIDIKPVETVESVSNKMKDFDNDEKQFAAITVHISDEEMYISYIGTDSTLYGWKEDFNMAFMDDVPCQLAGREYLRANC